MTKITIKIINQNHLKNLDKAIEAAGRYVKDLGNHTYEFSAKNRATLFMEILNEKTEEKIIKPVVVKKKIEVSEKSLTDKALDPEYFKNLKIAVFNMCPQTGYQLLTSYINNEIDKIHLIEQLEKYKALSLYPM